MAIRWRSSFFWSYNKTTQMIDFVGERAGTRTQDPLIKSQMLYRLSYALPQECGLSIGLRWRGQ